jgi:hypothetical protein
LYQLARKEKEIIMREYINLENTVKDPLATVQRGFGSMTQFYKFSQFAEYKVVKSIWINLSDTFDPEPGISSYMIFQITKDENVGYLVFDWNYNFKGYEDNLEDAHKLGKTCVI